MIDDAELIRDAETMARALAKVCRRLHEYNHGACEVCLAAGFALLITTIDTKINGQPKTDGQNYGAGR